MLRILHNQTLSKNILRGCTVRIRGGISRYASHESMQVLPRDEMIKKAKENPHYDVLIVGGGCTGAGVALDAKLRGLRVLCVEREDFSSGTSSRSTKLLWGGSRYLVGALVSLLNHDLRLFRKPKETLKRFRDEFMMVRNCHRERRFLLNVQSHLTNWIPIAVPFTKWLLWPPPFSYPPAIFGPLGIFPLFFKFYDALSGYTCPPSHIMSKARALRKFPQLNIDNLKYCSVFYEGQHNDSRTNLAIALTAAKHGASMINYCDLTKVHYDADGKANGGIICDRLTGESIEVKADCVVFCGGPFTDELRKLDDANCAPVVNGASGTHIVIPGYYCPKNIGLVDMSTSDGRFLFFLPWEQHVVIGTTDSPCEPSNRPRPSESEIQWLLAEASKYLSKELQMRRQDVLSAWTGIRPLAIDPNATDTASMSRDHVISVNPTSKIIFVAGGKWTTFREMAEDCVDKVIDINPHLKQKRKLRPCSTLQVPYVGKEGFTSNLPIRLIQEYSIASDISDRLSKAYGGRAMDVIEIAQSELKGFSYIVPGYPYIEAEVLFAVRHEWACKAQDILCRRTPLAFLNKTAALNAIPKIVELMAKELKWDSKRIQSETEDCISFLDSFGGPVPTVDIYHHS